MWCLLASLKICRKTFSPAEQEIGRGVLANLLSDSAVNLSHSVLEVRLGMSFPRWGRDMTREGEGYGEVVRPKGRPRRIGKKMPAHKRDIWRRGLALGGEVSRKVLVCNKDSCELFHRPSKRFSFGRCPISSCSWEPGRMVSIIFAKHHLVSTVHQKGVKVGGRRTPRDIHVETSQCGPPMLASTARISAVSKWALLLGGEIRGEMGKLD